MLSDDIIPASVEPVAPVPIKLGLQVPSKAKASAAKTGALSASSLDEEEQLRKREVVKLEYSEEELREMERGDFSMHQVLVGTGAEDDLDHSDAFVSYRKKKEEMPHLPTPAAINPADISNIHAKVGRHPWHT